MSESEPRREVVLDEALSELIRDYMEGNPGKPVLTMPLRELMDWSYYRSMGARKGRR